MPGKLRQVFKNKEFTLFCQKSDENLSAGMFK